MGAGAERLRLGTCVTNPAARASAMTASALTTLNGLPAAERSSASVAATRRGA
jgi:hypothetical protein